MPHSVDIGRQARIAKALVETSRDTFAYQLTQAGFDRPIEECKRIFDEDPAINRKVIAYNEDHVIGVPNAIEHVRTRFPDMFNGLGLQGQAEESLHQADDSDVPTKSRAEIARDIYRSMSGQNPQQPSQVQKRTALRGLAAKLSKARVNM